MGDLYDTYVGHASEDKDEIVRPLVDRLGKLGIKAWYDESNIGSGDIPLKKMDEGLKNSNSGLLIISHSFFNKKYTMEELYALLDAAVEKGKPIFLVLHEMTKEELREHSPLLATRHFFHSDEGINKIAEKLCERIKMIHDIKTERKAQILSSVSNHEEYIFFAKWDLAYKSDRFHYNEGIDIDSHGCVYTADEGGFVYKFNPDGTLIKKWGGKGKDDGKFETAYALAIDASDKIIVSDSNGRIQKFDTGGKFISKFGSAGSGDGQFGAPFGIAIDKFGSIFISDETNHRIQKFDFEGKLITKWGREGNANGDFQHPIGIATDDTGNVYVADNLNHRIQVFDNNGRFLAKWGSLGRQNGQFDHPHGITLDSANMVYVSDSVNNRIQKFTQNGIFITSWGSHGNNDGELNIPRDMVVDKEGSVYVSDGSNHRIQIFIPKSNSKKSKEAEEIQVRFYTERILDPNLGVAESSWLGLERLAEIKTIWKYEQVWSAINREILVPTPGNFANNALDLLKNILTIAARISGRKNEICVKSKSLYINKLSEILQSSSATWQYQKSRAKPIVDLITDEDERSRIFWDAWKRCTVEVDNDSQFAKYTGYFINDIINSSTEFKKSIEGEIFELIGSSKSRISERARVLYSLL